MGDLQVINRVVVDPAHRGHELGLFMIEAADAVVNSHMSAHIIKPFLLQFEQRDSCSYDFPEPPGKTEGFAVSVAPHPAREAAKLARQEQATLHTGKTKIRAHYAKLGFKMHGSTEYMLQWNGFRRPSLDEAMRK